jgi:hypothetical protein
MDLWRRLLRGTSRPPSPSDPGGPLEGIDTIDWAQLEHAYGPAADVPGQLRDVAVGGSRKRSKAMWALWGNIHHQGTVYSASAPAVPFLARLATSRAIPEDDRGQLVALISAIASGSSYLEVHEPMIRGGLSEEERQEMEEELGWVRAAHEAAAAVAPRLLAEIGEASPAMLWPLVMLAAQVPEAAANAAPSLRQMAGSSTDPVRRKALELTLALVDGTVTPDDLSGVLDVRPDLAELADPETWRTPAEGAKSLVMTLLEDAI